LCSLGCSCIRSGRLDDLADVMHINPLFTRATTPTQDPLTRTANRVRGSVFFTDPEGMMANEVPVATVVPLFPEKLTGTSRSPERLGIDAETTRKVLLSLVEKFALDTTLREMLSGLSVTPAAPVVQRSLFIDSASEASPSGPAGPNEPFESTRRPQNPAEGACWDALTADGWTVTKRGWPDFLAFRGDEVMAVEVKRAAAHSLKDSQERAMSALSARGVPCFRWALDSGLVRFRRKAGTAKAPIPKDPRHQRTVELFVRLWSETRAGGPYVFVGGRDGLAVKRLLAIPGATDAEIERRMRRALADPFFQRAGHLAYFVSRWSNYDRDPAPVGRAAGPAKSTGASRRVVGLNPDGSFRYAE
jgi:hypothetical protein